MFSHDSHYEVRVIFIIINVAPKTMDVNGREKALPVYCSGNYVDFKRFLDVIGRYKYLIWWRRESNPRELFVIH